MSKKLNFADIAAYRKAQGVNQSTFWTPYGVTQSGGSRYESGRSLPLPTSLLVWLHAEGRITDKDLEDARKAVAKAKAKK